MKKRVEIYFMLFILLFFTAYLFSQPQKPPELKREIVKLKYIRASQAQRVLMTYSSTPYGRIMSDDSLGLITIKDTPEIVAKMLSVIKEIDVKPADLEFVIDLFLATIGQGAERKPRLKSSDEPVVRELKTLLNLAEFELLDKSLARIQENRRLEMLMGGKGIELELRLEPRYIREEKGGMIQVQMRLMQRKDVKNVVKLIETTLSLKSGERTVVGVSKLDGGEKALVLLISGKVI
ncbi:MAG: secretin N-terminal domain-containing protein [Candidatus Aminicenantales bacterium]